MRKILIASADIPAAFPLVLSDVEIDGKRYQEMHVDGGAMAQVFLVPPSLHIVGASRAAGIQRQRIAYIVRNARLDPDWTSAERNTMSIAGRAISSLIHTQGIGDLYRIYLVTPEGRHRLQPRLRRSGFRRLVQGTVPSCLCGQAVRPRLSPRRTGYPWLKHLPGVTLSSRQ